MDQTGMWNLFFATGLPEAYLATRGEPGRGETAAPVSTPEPSQTAPVPSVKG